MKRSVFKNLFKALYILLALSMLLAAVSCKQATAEEETANQPLSPKVDILPSQEVKVISMNVWNAKEPGERGTAMVSVLNSYHADSIGVQECGGAWAAIFEEGLGARYGRIGIDCNGKESGSFATYIYYLKDKYAPINHGIFWLSETPDEPSKYSDTVDMNRTCTWVVLENLETGFRYVHMNCHLDWMDSNVNIVQMKMIRNQMLRFEAMGYPVFATGDYNTYQGSASYREMLINENISDAKMVAKTTMDAPTHNNGKVVDYCFVTGNKMDVLEYKVINERPNNVQLSDHFGVFTHAEVSSLPTQRDNDYTPAFATDAKLTIEAKSSKSTRLILNFPQARSTEGFLAVSYRVELFNLDGTLVSQRMVGARSFCELPPDIVNADFVGGLPTERYVIKITPISIFGEEGKPLCEEFVWHGERIDPIVLLVQCFVIMTLPRKRRRLCRQPL